jgi:predicted Fe-Mo cluster-binding NifX family protein
MKVAVPVDDKSMESRVCVSFGRAPYFLIFDTEAQEGEFIDNSAAASQGGAGIKAAQMVVDQCAGALLVPRCGQNAAEVLEAAGVKLYRTINQSIQDNVAAFCEGKLSALEDIHPGFHGHARK